MIDFWLGITAYLIDMAAARDLYRTELMDYLRICHKVILLVHDFDPLRIFFLLILLDDKILCFCSGC